MKNDDLSFVGCKKHAGLFRDSYPTQFPRRSCACVTLEIISCIRDPSRHNLVEPIVNELLIGEIKPNNAALKLKLACVQTYDLLTVVEKRDSSSQVKYIYAKFVELLSYLSNLVKNYFTKENK